MSNSIYKSGVTDQSLSLDDIAPGLTLGHERYENGNVYVLAKSTGALADGVACQVKTASGEVVATPATGAIAPTTLLGFNNSGVVTAANTYLWLLRRGNGYAVSNGNIADGQLCRSSAGGLISATAGTVSGGDVICTAKAARTGAGVFNVYVP